jgi:Helix-turn-helix domain
MLYSPELSATEESKPPSNAVRHLTQLDVARRWRISPRTLERWRWIGGGPQYLRVGGRVIYRLADIEAFEQAQLCGSKA